MNTWIVVGHRGSEVISQRLEDLTAKLQADDLTGLCNTPDSSPISPNRSSNLASN